MSFNTSPDNSQLDLTARLERAITETPEVRGATHVLMDEALTLGIMRGVQRVLADPESTASLTSVDPLGVNEIIDHSQQALPGLVDTLVNRIETATIAAIEVEFPKI